MPTTTSKTPRPRRLLAALGAAALSALACPAAHAAPVLGQGTWETVLKARDINGYAVALNDATAAFFYDAEANITWQRALGTTDMDWRTASDWAANLSTGGFSDWRLPTVIDTGTPGCDSTALAGTDCGYNVQTQVGGAFNEWAHLFHDVLGNKAYYSPSGTPNQPGYLSFNTAYFVDLERTSYWSGTKVRDVGAWYFGMTGHQGNATLDSRGFAAAVRTGDVLREASNAVPEPQSLVLALGALGMLAGSRRAVRARPA